MENADGDHKYFVNHMKMYPPRCEKSLAEAGLEPATLPRLAGMLVSVSIINIHHSFGSFDLCFTVMVLS